MRSILCMRSWCMLVGPHIQGIITALCEPRVICGMRWMTVGYFSERSWILRKSINGVLMQDRYHVLDVSNSKPEINLWQMVGDSQVKQVSEKSVLDQKAYILFYIKDSVTQSSAGTEQLLRNSLPAFKKLLSDGAGETADDSSADDLDHNGRQVSNARASQSAVDRVVPAANSNNSLTVRPAGNSQVAACECLDL